MRKRFMLILMATLLFTIAPIIEASAATPNEIVTLGKKQLGVRYLWGGTTTSGFDCSGFTGYVFKQAGINLNRTAASQYSHGTAVSKSNLKAGDLVFFAGTGGKGGISHVGIYIGSRQMISATSSRGIAIDNIDTNPYWAPRYAGAKRINGVSDAPAVVPPAPAPVLPPVVDGNFADVSSSHTAYEAIKTLNVQGVISGFPNQQFRPNETVTRGQAAAMINRVLGYTSNAASPYSDVGTTHSFAKDIAAMTEKGILIGYSNGKFGVEDTLTKAQLAIILDRAFDEKNAFHTSNVNNATTRAEFSEALYSAM
ncbi:C40 family peptidase [Sporosarcina sp. G11-34]|uniref:C40 family peptidase n=1 Tax=Sporosarcina sp. G11-34 TaxID=2849605 RepID=UPI0022A95D8F|nr:C40 family peptidase [Sporosarcina sp. G11-34]MCZ2257570.1 C40 family peptidase [Sporosarcina sp. G11-34]